MPGQSVTAERNELRPNPGPQTEFLRTRADICVYGGAAGGGKSKALLLEPLRYHQEPTFGAVVFRRIMPSIKKGGGLWAEARSTYTGFGAEFRENPMEVTFPSGAKIEFSHLQYEQDKYAWNGAQIPLIEFDQLEEFTEGQFWYLQSRARSATFPYRPYVRASANPRPGWLAELLQWWWDPNTGYAILERSGVIRWLIRVDDKIVWGDSRQGCIEEAVSVHKMDRDDCMPRSFTFIHSNLEDNPYLGHDYRATLLGLPLVDRERQLHGNWKIEPAAGLIFNRAWFEIVDALPAGARFVRGWDKAATPGGGDWSAGVLMAEKGGLYYVCDVVRGQWSYGEREKVILQTAEMDRDLGSYEVALEQEPGSGGKESAQATVRNLAGFTARAETSTGSKDVRAKPLASQAEVGNVKIVRGAWNRAFLDELHAFTGEPTNTDDQVDAAAVAFNALAKRRSGLGWAPLRM